MMFGSEFATKEEFVKEAFYKVMSEISISTHTKDSLYQAYKLAHLNGSPRGEEKAVEQYLLDQNWVWPSFEHWKSIFSKTKKYPYMWLKCPELFQPPDPAPKSLQTAVSLFTVAELKGFLKDNGLLQKPAPKTREEVEKAVISTEKWDLFQPILKNRYMNLSATHEYVAKSYLCKLLAHTLTMSIYALRDSKQRVDLKPMGRKLVADAVAGCAVESDFCRRWNRGELTGLPPFFPGDRSCLIWER